MKIIAAGVFIFVFAVNNTDAQKRRVSINTNILNLVAIGPSLAVNYDMAMNWNIQLYASTGRFNGLNYAFKTGIIDLK